MIIIINKKVQIYPYTKHNYIQIIIIIYMNGISINRQGGSVGNVQNNNNTKNVQSYKHKTIHTMMLQ